jgi:hypothetical protein
VAHVQNQNTTLADRASGIVGLPNTSPQNRRSFTHVRIVTRVDADAWNGAGFHGALFQPGARIPTAELPPAAVALEYCGPQGTWRQRNREREFLWILWRYDWEAADWREIARAVSRDWHWALVLRAPAILALGRPAVDLAEVDPVERGQAVTDELLAGIDSAVSLELPAVRMAVLTSIYDSLAGRIVAA